MITLDLLQAGGSGELLFEYDWIVPDQEILNELPLESLGSTELSDLFYEKLQITVRIKWSVASNLLSCAGFPLVLGKRQEKHHSKE